MEYANRLIKASGDVLHNRGLFDFLSEKSSGGITTIIIGGGTQINEAFQKRGWAIGFDSDGRRVTQTKEQARVAREAIDLNRYLLQRNIDDLGLRSVFLQIPYLKFGPVWIPFNGDEFFRLLLRGFDEGYVMTTPERLVKKSAEFADLRPKAQVVAI